MVVWTERKDDGPEGRGGLIPPHGGRLVRRELTGREGDEARAAAAEMPVLPLTEEAAADLLCVATGVYSPLTGFMTREDYWRVLDDMRLARGHVWSLPITLPVAPEKARQLPIGGFAALRDRTGAVVGTLRVEDVFARDLAYEAGRVFGTRDDRHPGVARLYGSSDILVGGDVWLFRRPGTDDGVARSYARDPASIRAEFVRRGWRRVVGFQTRNPVHRAHEYIQKCALEIVDGLLLHPLVGSTKGDDVPAALRLRSYEVLLEHYFPADRVLLAAFPAAMRYAGPREAIFHALCRKNYGCSHFIVGRDHAGVGRYYGSYDAQRVFLRFGPEELGVTPLFFEHAFYCRRCGGMATVGTCGHGDDARVVLSGTKVRALLRGGRLPPAEWTRPEVARVLAEGMGGAALESAAERE